MVAAAKNNGDPRSHNWRALGSFGLQVLTGRWFMVFASLLIMSVSGAGYLFGLYSEDVKSSLGYDQTTLNLLGFSKDVGGNVGVIAGLINEISPPWVVLFLGAVMNLFGYLMIWLAVTGRTEKPPVWLMCAYICIGANSQTFSNTGALVTCVKNFPESRGAVIGLLKGFVGLSGAIIAQLYRAFYGHDSKALILLIAWLPAVVSFISLRTVRILRVVRQVNELRVFYRLLFVALGLAGFLMITIVLQNTLAFSRAEYAISASIVLILLITPLTVVIREELNTRKRKNQVLNDRTQVEVTTQNPGSSMEQVPPVVKPESLHLPETAQRESMEQASRAVEPELLQLPETAPKKADSCWSNILRPPERGEDYTILQALFSIDMLILFTVTIFGVGGDLTAVNNLGQIGRALGYPAKSITTFVSLVSIWNFLGRVSAGYVSEIFLAKYKFPRPLILTIVLLISCSGHLLIAFGVPNSLYVASVIMGFCFGAQWPLVFTIISEIFGLKYYSTLLNIGGAASPIGAYILNVRVAGHLYDAEALKQMAAKGLTRKPGQDLTCIGVKCYRLAFLIVTAATFFACIFSFILVLRTRKFYKGDIYKKFRVQSGEVDSEITMIKSKRTPAPSCPPPPPPPPAKE